ncbi:hypothetical protein TcWFU_002502 [Taenia crassiceps]|uniref:Uncharacterized protein n=1 Tax=Taenia crassiceps TaxID=6207 RepID=A0ABR4QPX0_9CEST
MLWRVELMCDVGGCDVDAFVDVAPRESPACILEIRAFGVCLARNKPHVKLFSIMITAAGGVTAIHMCACVRPNERRSSQSETWNPDLTATSKRCLTLCTTGA